MKLKPIIYVCSPLRGDVKRNINKAIGYSRYVYVKGGIPLAPHTIFTQFLDDEDEDERNVGIDMGLELLNICDELWAFGDKISEGMLNEIESAKSLGLIVRRFNERCEPLDE